MTEVELAALVAAARSAMGLPMETPARAWWVYPPEGEEPAYVLVELGAEDRAVGVAAVDHRNGSVMTSARLPGQRRHLALDEHRALRLAGHPAGRVRLVWQPSRQSRSPLYPLWHVHGASGTPEPVYVDQAGGTWPRLDRGGPGGGSAPDLPSGG